MNACQEIGHVDGTRVLALRSRRAYLHQCCPKLPLLLHCPVWYFSKSGTVISRTAWLLYWLTVCWDYGNLPLPSAIFSGRITPEALWKYEILAGRSGVAFPNKSLAITDDKAFVVMVLQRLQAVFSFY